MPRVKIDYIVSFSSEDPEHPASNLLSWEVGKRRWLCPAGESSCSVVLQLSHAVQISAIHIGTYHAAVIEVLIGRSEAPDSFEVLVPSSVFLTPSESRKEPQDRVRSFSGTQLTSTQRGDRLRVVCRQPYNKQCKYGLSFIHIFEPENGSSSAPTPKVATPVPVQASRAIAASALGHSSSDEEDYRPGQLFAATRTTAATSTDTGSQIRKATSQILKNISDTPTKIVKSPIVKNTSSSSKQNDTEPNSNRHRNSLMYTDDEEKPHSKIDSVVQRRNDEKAKEKDAQEAKQKLLKEKKDRENAKQSESEPKRNKHDERSKKDDHRASSNTNDFNTSQNREKNNNHNKTNRGKNDDTPRRDNNNFGHRSKDDKANLDRSKDDHNRHKNRHNDDSTKPGTSNDSDSRNKDKTPPNRKRDNRDQDRKTGVKRARTSNDTGDLQAGPVSSTPHTLLSDCSLVLSGYVHPQRGQIRSAAIALGARVLPDWGPRATHLICAFPNTPKLKQALAGNPSTPVATGEWVEKCCELRRLLPWQWFATEPAKRVPMPDLSTLPDGNDDQSPRDEEGDTDDEIEKVLREQKKRRRSNTPEAQAGNTPKAQVGNTPEAQVGNTDQRDDSTDDVEFVRDERIQGRLTVHDSDSDMTVGDDDRKEDKSVTLSNMESDTDITDPKSPDSSPGRVHSPLPNFFEGCTFYIAPDVSSVGIDENLLKRYVRAYGGVLVEEWSEEDDPVDYVLCAGAGSGVRGSSVRADWLWRCHAERKLVATHRYLV